MADNCGCEITQKFDGSSKEYKRILVIIIAINLVMFFVEVIGGISSRSVALLADSLDFLGDATTYTISLLVIGLSLATRAKAGMFKGISLLVIATWVLGTTAYRIMYIEVPEPMTMGAVGIVAFGANVLSALLLLRYKDGDSNVRSVWLCSRNDAIGNLAVVIAASGIAASDTAWPDLIVAFVLAGLFLNSAVQIIRLSRAELKLSAIG